MDRIAVIVDYLEKTADAMARAYQRGRLPNSLGTPDKPHSASPEAMEAFSDRIAQLEPRNSGRMGMISGDKPFSGAAEGKVYLGSMRGRGLGIRKEFWQPQGDEESYWFHDHKTRTVKARAEVMKSNPNLFPKVYGHVSGADPREGAIDMEFVHGQHISELDKLERETASNYVERHLNRMGYQKDPTNSRTYYNPESGVIVNDLHGNNIMMDRKTKLPKIIDPMVVHDSEPGLKNLVQYLKGVIPRK